MAQISVKEDNDEKILCPHCGEELTEVIKNTSFALTHMVSFNSRG